MCVCVCMCVCGCMCVCVCARACTCVRVWALARPSQALSPCTASAMVLKLAPLSKEHVLYRQQLQLLGTQVSFSSGKVWRAFGHLNVSWFRCVACLPECPVPVVHCATVHTCTAHTYCHTRICTHTHKRAYGEGEGPQ